MKEIVVVVTTNEIPHKYDAKNIYTTINQLPKKIRPPYMRTWPLHRKTQPNKLDNSPQPLKSYPNSRLLGLYENDSAFKGKW
jgi:hypothetical protein